MKRQEQRIAIAKACGWHVSYDPPHYQGLHPELHEADDAPVALPDYLNDLNAMHEAEICLVDQGKGADYGKHLAAMSGGYLSRHLASAAQRAEAFLKTLNLWID
jgi:hypothetical protein